MVIVNTKAVDIFAVIVPRNLNAQKKQRSCETGNTACIGKIFRLLSRLYLLSIVLYILTFTNKYYILYLVKYQRKEYIHGTDNYYG